MSNPKQLEEIPLHCTVFYIPHDLLVTTEKLNSSMRA